VGSVLRELEKNTGARKDFLQDLVSYRDRPVVLFLGYGNRYVGSSLRKIEQGHIRGGV